MEAVVMESTVMESAAGPTVEASAGSPTRRDRAARARNSTATSATLRIFFMTASRSSADLREVYAEWEAAACAWLSI